MRTTRTQAIVLRRTNYGEADRILQLMTPLGRRAAIARGVRKEKSRLAGGIELFAVSDIVLGKGKGELDILTTARLVHFYRHILDDYDRMQFAYDVLKNIASASESLDEPEWFDVAVNVLSALDVKSIDIRLIRTWFYVQYASILGHGLSLHRDVDGEVVSADETYSYDVSEQGLRRATNGALTVEHIKLLRLIAVKPLKALAQIGGIEDVLAETEYVAHQHAAI